MLNRRQRPVTFLVVAAFVWATAGVPTRRPAELVACPYLSVCLPRAACQSSNVTFDAKYSNDFACGVLQQSVGHVCCAVSSRGFLPSAQNWLPNTQPSAPAVPPWLGFQPNAAYEDGYFEVKSSPESEFPISNSAGFKAIVFPGEAIDETDFRSAQQNTKGWSCGEVLSTSALNETYTAEERLINQGDYPWQVAVLTVGMRYICGGALLGSGTVLTLASCIHNVAGDQLLIRVGDQDLSSNREPLPAFDVPVNGIALHPAYDPSSRQFDLAVLQLQHSVSSLPYVRGACLPLSDLNLPTTLLGHQLSEQFGQLFLSNPTVAPDLTHCHLASWGLEAEEQGTEGSFSYILRGGQFYILSREVCQAILGRNEILSTVERCAAGYGGTAICRGGGGSALVCRAGDRFLLEGIIARSTRCSINTPLVYVKVSDHLNFILDHLKLQSTRKEESIQPATSTNYHGSVLNNEKTDGIQGEKPSSTFNLRGRGDNFNSAKPLGNSATSPDSRNDALRGFSKGDDPSLLNGSLFHGNGGGRIPIKSSGKNLSQITPTGIPVISYSTINNIGNDRETNENVESNVAESSIFQFGEVIVPDGNEQQTQSGSSIAKYLMENKDNGLTSALTNTNRQEIDKDLAETDATTIGSDETDEAVHLGQGGDIFVPGDIFTPLTSIHQEDNTSGLIDGISTLANDDLQKILIDNGEVSISKRVVDTPKNTIDLKDPDSTNGFPKRDGSLFDINHNSDKLDGFISENLSDLGYDHFRPSTIKSPTTTEPSFQTQQVSGDRFIGSFIDDSKVNLPHLQSPGRAEFYDWRLFYFQNPLIPSRVFHGYNPTYVFPFPDRREPYLRRDPFFVHLRPYRGHRPLYPRPQLVPPPSNLQPSIGPLHHNMVLFQQSYTPIYSPEPLPNPPPFFDAVLNTPPQLVKMSVGSGITTDQTLLSPQPDIKKSDVSEVNGNESDPNLHKVQHYLSRYQ